MRYLPLTTDDRDAMLVDIGVETIDDLFVDVPAAARLDGPVDLPRVAGELEVERQLQRLAAKNVTAGSVPLELVQGVICNMVLRVVKNPMSLRSFGVDDGQATIDSTASTGAMYVADDELALLTASSTDTTAAVRSLSRLAERTGIAVEDLSETLEALASGDQVDPVKAEAIAALRDRFGEAAVQRGIVLRGEARNQKQGEKRVDKEREPDE